MNTISERAVNNLISLSERLYLIFLFSPPLLVLYHYFNLSASCGCLFIHSQKCTYIGLKPQAIHKCNIGWNTLFLYCCNNFYCKSYCLLIMMTKCPGIFTAIFHYLVWQICVELSLEASAIVETQEEKYFL